MKQNEADNDNHVGKRNDRDEARRKKATACVAGANREESHWIPRKGRGPNWFALWVALRCVALLFCPTGEFFGGSEVYARCLVVRCRMEIAPGNWTII